ncbi:Asp-tRNA(Asn)/Glu-tRNA(Gln) amidotransferase subunit GatB [Candidatus Woesearchaeota archaeon]|nr:Asp-tRNA(Asn)/Glu-tRNA(Gln) amidotransferase subunit GatB [Candidatus Woesearchaeota archaeon]
MVKIGLEIHGYLAMNRTRQKLFCCCPIAADALPNTIVCPRCTGQPGSKPMLPNGEAVEKVLACSLMLDCTVNRKLIFQRKHYDWPDLPKGYQMTISGSYSHPVGEHGSYLDIGIRECHLEEDPARWDPETGLVDYNRSGYPLIEIVTEPDFTSSEQVKLWLESLLTTLSYIKAVSRNAGIKCDVNVSTDHHPRVEIKNVNSIRAIVAAIDGEIRRQHDAVTSGEKVFSHTRSPPDAHGMTHFMRSKETALDYMFIPEPDLPVLHIPEDLLVSIQKTLPEKPHLKVVKFQKMGLSPIDARILASDLALAELFERVAKVINPILAAKWLRHELLKVVNASEKALHELGLDEGYIIELLQMVEKKEVTDQIAAQLLLQLTEKSFSPRAYVARQGLGIISKEDELGVLAEKVIAENQSAVKDYLAGEEKALNFLMGKVMALSKGKAKPDTVKMLLKQRIAHGQNKD